MFIDVSFDFNYFQFVVIIGGKLVLLQLFKWNFPVWIIDFFLVYIETVKYIFKLKNNYILFMAIIAVIIVFYITHLTATTLKQ